MKLIVRRVLIGSICGTVRSIGWGAVVGLVGGLVFLPIITIVTGLPQLAGLVGGTWAALSTRFHSSR